LNQRDSLIRGLFINSDDHCADYEFYSCFRYK
jgi:hypothetical protein